MKNKQWFAVRMARWGLVLWLALPVAWTTASARQDTEGPPPAPAAAAKAAAPLNFKPGPDDGRIAFVTVQLLERHHYSRQPFDAAMSSKLLDRYLRDLDPQHIHFLQSDLAQFEGYRNRLHDLILRRGDTYPAYVIFGLFLVRLEQRVEFATELLKTEKFDFDRDERVTLNRKDLPFPKDLEEAKQLWRERLRYEYLQEKLNKQKPEQIVETLTRRHTRVLKTFREWDSENVLEIYLTALAHVYDPHSDYLGKSQLENFAIGMNLSLFGIGAELQSEDGYCKVRRLLPGGPAVESKKLKPNDKIVAVAQGSEPPVDIVDMLLTKAVSLIRGTNGTEVRLTIIPANAADPSVRKVLSLIRREIKLEDQEAKAKIIEVPAPAGGHLRLGVVDLPSFYGSMDLGVGPGKSQPRSTSEDVAKLLKKLTAEKVSGVILDLRRNGGGSLEEAIKVTGLFIKQGPVVQVRDPDGTVKVDEDKDGEIAYDGPLLLLTSRFSASASEIVAGALQDYGRALIVGESSTHGKGTVQSLNSLKGFLRMAEGSTNDPGALKLTIRKFYRASGQSTQLKGVTPDLVLPSINNVAEVGEGSLENPLPWDTIKAAKFEALHRVEPYLAELRQRAAEREQADQDFAYAREDVELAKKILADKTISLNEKQRIAEKEEADARQKARDKERLARTTPDEKIFEISLKLADQPGLPPPVARTNALAAAKTGTGGDGQVATTLSTVPVAGFATNSASIATPRISVPKGNDSEESADEEKAPAVDYELEEAKRILTDYLSLLPKPAVVTLNTSSPAR